MVVQVDGFYMIVMFAEILTHTISHFISHYAASNELFSTTSDVLRCSNGRREHNCCLQSIPTNKLPYRMNHSSVIEII